MVFKINEVYINNPDIFKVKVCGPYVYLKFRRFKKREDYCVSETEQSVQIVEKENREQAVKTAKSFERKIDNFLENKASFIKLGGN